MSSSMTMLSKANGTPKKGSTVWSATNKDADKQMAYSNSSEDLSANAPKASPLFSGIVFTGRYANYTKADTWYPSWASDGNLYSPWTDGFIGKTGFVWSGKGMNAETGYAKIEGDDPLNLTVSDWGVLVAKSHHTIWTKESYDNFILDLEFKVAKDSNSGVFLRSSNTKNVLAALEIQVHESKDGSPYGMVGAIYDSKPPEKKMQKPVGEWNHFTITCNDNKMSLVFNGEKVWDIDLNNWKEPHKNPDGTRNKFRTALKDFSRKGPIGFQGLHGKAQAPVWYRNIKIKEIK